jgi:hypothetical protein
VSGRSIESVWVAVTSNVTSTVVTRIEAICGTDVSRPGVGYWTHWCAFVRRRGLRVTDDDALAPPNGGFGLGAENLVGCNY